MIGTGDFGVSQVFKYVMSNNQIDRAHGCVGTRPYIAPEEFVHEHYDAIKVDIWALGVTYVTMRLGHNPWQTAQVDSDSSGGASSSNKSPVASRTRTPYFGPIGKNPDCETCEAAGGGGVDAGNIGGGEPRLIRPSPTWQDHFLDPGFDYFAHHKDTRRHEFARIIVGSERDFVMKMLEIDPFKRSNSQELLNDDWFKVKTANC